MTPASPDPLQLQRFLIRTTKNDTYSKDESPCG